MVEGVEGGSCFRSHRQRRVLLMRRDVVFLSQGEGHGSQGS